MNFGLASLYVNLGLEADLAVWLAPLTMSILLGLIGIITLKKGKSTLSEMSVKPDKTIGSLKSDKDWAKEKVRKS